MLMMLRCSHLLDYALEGGSQIYGRAIRMLYRLELLTYRGVCCSESLSVACRQRRLRSHKLLSIAEKEGHRQRRCPGRILLLELVVGMPEHVLGVVAEGQRVQLSISVVGQIAASACRHLQHIPLCPSSPVSKDYLLPEAPAVLRLRLIPSLRCLIVSSLDSKAVLATS